MVDRFNAAGDLRVNRRLGHGAASRRNERCEGACIAREAERHPREAVTIRVRHGQGPHIDVDPRQTAGRLVRQPTTCLAPGERLRLRTWHRRKTCIIEVEATLLVFRHRALRARRFALRRAGCCRVRHAQRIPGLRAARRVLGAHGVATCSIAAGRGAVGHIAATGIRIAAGARVTRLTERIRIHRAGCIPLHGAAERIELADGAAADGVIALGGRVRKEAAPQT